MSKQALLIIPPDRFNEDELFHPKAELEQAGITVTVASTKTGEITGDNQGKVVAEAVFSDLPAGNYDVVAVIGGSGTIDYLWGDEKLQHYVKEAYNQNILVAGICAGSVAVVKTGLLKGRQATCYPVDVMIDQLKANDVNYVVQHVVAHDDIITSDGPEGARAFGQALVEALSAKANA
ncbi:DJ-1/PfpI family protein [Paenibacillus sp. HN-1]|uniref:DJ-1/PfpI family protein n=1 Tax=Paenibacillus TaxID=44249 RepID=UPI001CA83258|nr:MULTISPECIES: DJ-1/PfpI family protein [Paenibacillus]MBY9077877.1 DJ-1/PfpI family protein [Paenibacillus sp. CGMCC 1.18879]MBY9088167.1 DJ-1/PfpI family protein [Paenibacillus sinensis]